MKKLNIDEYILSNYKTMTNAQMALELGCNKSTISNHRKNLGISATELNKTLRTKIPYICSQYGRKTAHAISKELNYSVSFIKKIWRENNLSGTISTNYYYNENYFNIIDTPEKAYWLGFIAADGNLYKREGHQGLISIGVHEKDIQLLEYFKAELNTSKPITISQDKRREQTKIAVLQITSDIIFNRILEYGIGIRKTYDMDLAQVINNIPNQYFNSFLLGYFDGDGSIGISNDNTISRSHIRIAGPIKSLQALQNKLTEFGIDAVIITDKRKYKEPFGSLELTNTIMKYTFLKFIYYAKIKCMERKKLLAEEFISRIDNNITNRSENIKALENYKSVVLKWGELLER